MSWTRNIYDQTNRPVGQTTLRKLIIAFIIFLIPVIGFTYIGEEVHDGDTTQIDNRVLLNIYHKSTPVLNEIVVRTTDYGGVAFTLGVTAVLCGVYILREKWQKLAQLAAGVLGAGLLNFGLKLLFERNRPNLWEHLISETSYSFPSGHAMLSSALALSIVAIMWSTRWRWLTIVLATLYIGYIGFTRLYLGVHYPTDVIAGWCVSAAWVLVVAVILGSVNLSKILKKAEK